MKLTKQQRKLHQEACDLLGKDDLTYDEKWFVLENWHEGATNNNGASGAFFTPPELASDFGLDVGGGSIIDLCAGIGTLSFVYYHHRCHGEKPQIACVEINPEYVEVGKKIFPEANWICADIFDIWRDLGRFDWAIANPPFGNLSRGYAAPRYAGSLFEYKILDLASHMADYGTFLLPHNSAGFRYSGAQCYARHENAQYRKFAKETGLFLDAGCGVDTTYYADGWKGVKPCVEIVCCDFTEAEPLDVEPCGHDHAQQLALFSGQGAS